MAKIDFDGVMIETNWATEQTLRDLVSVLRTGSAGSGDGSSTKLSKSVDVLNRNINRLVSSIKGGGLPSPDELKKAVLGNNDKAEKADVKKSGLIRRASDELIQSHGEISGSASSVVVSFLKIAGIAGILGTAIGLAAGAIDTIIKNFVSAMQSGFSFSDQLAIIRDNLAEVGMNVAGLNEVIATNGHNIRMMGDSSFDAMNAFIEMTKQTRRASKEFGFFGLTAEETMGELAGIAATLRKTGLSGASLADATSDSFETLNKEVMAYARITGRNRRDLMRDSAVDTDTLVQSLLKKYDASAVTNLKSIEMLLRSAGDTGELFDMVKTTFAVQETGISKLFSQAQREMMSMYPEINKTIVAMTNMITDPTATITDKANAMANLRASLENSGDILVRNMASFDNTQQETAKMLNSLLLSSTAYGDRGEMIAALELQLTKAEQNLLFMNDAILQIKHTFLSQIFKIFGLDNIEEGMTQEALDEWLSYVRDAGDGLAYLMHEFKMAHDSGDIAQLMKDLAMLGSTVMRVVDAIRWLLPNEGGGLITKADKPRWQRGMDAEELDAATRGLVGDQKEEAIAQLVEHRASGGRPLTDLSITTWRNGGEPQVVAPPPPNSDPLNHLTNRDKTRLSRQAQWEYATANKRYPSNAKLEDLMVELVREARRTRHATEDNQ
jgi:hypothetical protein